jgi:hypothetical protein
MVTSRGIIRLATAEVRVALSSTSYWVVVALAIVLPAAASVGLAATDATTTQPTVPQLLLARSDGSPANFFYGMILAGLPALAGFGAGWQGARVTAKARERGELVYCAVHRTRQVVILAKVAAACAASCICCATFLLATSIAGFAFHRGGPATTITGTQVSRDIAVAVGLRGALTVFVLALVGTLVAAVAGLRTSFGNSVIIGAAPLFIATFAGSVPGLEGISRLLPSAYFESWAAELSEGLVAPDFGRMVMLGAFWSVALVCLAAWPRFTTAPRVGEVS